MNMNIMLISAYELMRGRESFDRYSCATAEVLCIVEGRTGGT